MSAHSQNDNEYSIRAIPTRYAGATFRSRLEARWAAYFDLCAIRWVYEPIDLHGWAPDFLLSLPGCAVYVEVKPVDLVADGYERFAKAVAHSDKHTVLLCGLSPLPAMAGKLICPEGNEFNSLTSQLSCTTAAEAWSEAGAKVQWIAREERAEAKRSQRPGVDLSKTLPLLTDGERRDLESARQDYNNGLSQRYLGIRLELQTTSKQRVLDEFRVGSMERDEARNLIVEHDLGAA